MDDVAGWTDHTSYGIESFSIDHPHVGTIMFFTIFLASFFIFIIVSKRELSLGFISQNILVSFVISSFVTTVSIFLYVILYDLYLNS